MMVRPSVHTSHLEITSRISGQGLEVVFRLVIRDFNMSEFISISVKNI